MDHTPTSTNAFANRVAAPNAVAIAIELEKMEASLEAAEAYMVEMEDVAKREQRAQETLLKVVEETGKILKKCKCYLFSSSCLEVYVM